MIPGRASVVRDRHGRRLIVAAPKSAADLVKHIPGAEWDHLVRRYLVPVAQEDALRGALSGLDVAWTEDHRTVHRPPVPLSAEKSAPRPAEPEQGSLW